MAFLSEKLISASATEETDDDFNLVTGLYKFDGSNGGRTIRFLIALLIAYSHKKC